VHRQHKGRGTAAATPQHAASGRGAHRAITDVSRVVSTQPEASSTSLDPQADIRGRLQAIDRKIRALVRRRARIASQLPAPTMTQPVGLDVGKGDAGPGLEPDVSIPDQPGVVSVACTSSANASSPSDAALRRR
jgi:hypothetical protein